MKVYVNRHHPDYIKMLREHLSFQGDNGILKKAIKTKTPYKFGGKDYDRCCRIDFTGVAATTLFDTSGDFCPTSVADLMKNLFHDASILNDQGIFVKLRMLLVYPYSDYAFARMQAEATVNRSSISQPEYLRNFNVVESVDERMFMMSHFVRAQSSMLEYLQELVDTYGWNRKTLNRATVRFVPSSPNFCLLFVNDTIFQDPYLLAKRVQTQKRLELTAPLVQIEGSIDQDVFATLDDHFRYLWDLDLSIYCQDATYYEPHVPKSLGKIKLPHEISFDAKAGIIKEKSPAIPDEDVLRWKFKVRQLLMKFCTMPTPTPGSETVFITCSWRNEDGQATPNPYAMELSTILEEDFGRARRIPLISVFVMEAVAGAFFSQQLYARLEESTLGLVLLTADIKGKDGKYYSRPNVYHELGYLMKHLGSERVAVVCEEGVTVPSNINDVIRIDFTKDKLILAYAKIAGWIFRSCALGKLVREETVTKQMARLDKFALDGKISVGEAKKAKERTANFFIDPRKG